MKSLFEKGETYYLPIKIEKDDGRTLEVEFPNHPGMLPALTLREIQLIVGALDGYAVDTPANRELLEKLDAYRKVQSND